MITYIMVKMSDNYISSEPIINPAPAQVSINDSDTQVEERRSQPVVQTRTIEVISRSREDKIRDLKRELRIIKNITQPIIQYIQFQQIMDPKLRVIIDVNQWTMLLLAAKGTITSLIEDNYVDITDPPEDLMGAMNEGYDNIDSLVTAFTASMSQIVTLMQTQLASTPLIANPSTSDLSNDSILAAMTPATKSRRNLPS